MDIAIDFDGTCVTHEFPYIGRDIGAVPVLMDLVSAGHNLILFTMRSDVVDPISTDSDITVTGGKYLSVAVQWFTDNNIPLYGIQKNPTQEEWTHSPKAYAQLYIDDAALGCPLVHNPLHSSRPFVDWELVRDHLEIKGIL